MIRLLTGMLVAATVLGVSYGADGAVREQGAGGAGQGASGFTVDVQGPSGWEPGDAVLPGADGLFRVRIAHDGRGLAVLDGVKLRAGGRELRPLRAVDAATGEDVTTKLRKADRDVINLQGRTVEVSFEARKAGAEAGAASVELQGHVAESGAAAAVPCAYPSRTHPWQANETSFTYELNQRYGSMSLDPLSDRAGGRDAPFFALPGTVGYVRNDDAYLYGELDFTADNLPAMAEDFAAMLVKTPKGWKEFRVSQAETTWGRAGYASTDNASFQHKVYRFRIPLAELGVDPSRHPRIEFRYLAYGAAVGLAGR